MQMTGSSRLIAVALASSAFLFSCGGSGGGGSSDEGGGISTPTNSAAPAIKTYATTGEDGTARQVDLIAGPIVGVTDTANQVLSDFLKTVMTRDGVDLDGNLMGGGDVAYSGFESYSTGLQPTPGSAGRIFGANNLYDLFQITTGAPQLTNLFGTVGPPYNGGDSNFDGLSEGGPGLFSNAAFPVVLENIYPTPAVLPNAMGDRSSSGSARGPSPTDQHQFIQIEFPYNIDIDSLFNPFGENSFLGDSQLGSSLNVLIERRWVTFDPIGDDDPVGGIIDHTFERAHVPGIAIIGGQAAIPDPVTGGAVTVDVGLSNLPTGAIEKINNPRVFTYIAHENPEGISGVGSDLGFINSDGILILPDPTDMGGKGGRVFGASEQTPSSVNDFGSDGAGGTSTANQIGFVSFEITRVRSKGQTFNDVYFHSFPVSQAFVSGDTDLFPDAQDGTDSEAVNGSFNRGPAVVVDSVLQIPAIDVANPNTDYLGSFNPTPESDSENVISTRSRFRIDFDKEVVPNSVGFSRRHTIHSVVGKGVIFPFNGNTRPIPSPSESFVSGIGGAPLAPSIFIAVNQPVSVAVNNPLTKNVNTNPLFTDAQLNGDQVPVGTEATPGLFPLAHNSLATLPRGVVPCDIYPVNQNNLQAYIVEPLVDLPPGSIVTVGVCMPGLGTSNNALPDSPLDLPYVPADPTNFGNFTRSGTVFTPWQGLTPIGSGNPDITQVTTIVGNATIVKVNAGPMDLSGNLFFGGTGTAVDWLINGTTDDDLSNGGWNVCRTFQVGNDLKNAYVNAPVAPQAIVVGFGPQGLGCIDLSGTGFTTNAPGGGGLNTGNENLLIVSRYLAPPVSGLSGTTNWSSNGSLASGNHQRAFGVAGRYTAGNCFSCMPRSKESEYAVGRAIRAGANSPDAPPGVNEGSSGFETMVRNSFGSQFLTDKEDIALVNDVLVGDFLDTVYFDPENPFSTVNNHRTYNTPAATAVSNNTIADPPAPNPPPLRFPVGLPHTAVIFDQDDLSDDPVLIEGNEVFGRDRFLAFDDGSGFPPFSYLVNTFIQLNPTSNTSNSQSFDVPHLPNAGFPSPFTGEGFTVQRFVQTGPMPKTTTAGAVVLSTLNAALVPAEPGGLLAPFYQSRQQIGNFLFVTDGVNKKLHAVNSNTYDVLESLSLPDPTGLGMTSDLRLLYVSNQGANNVSVVDADPRSATFMTELARIPVGDGPRAVAVAPDNEDVFVLNRLSNSISIIDVGSNAVRRTLEQSGINRPNDIALGMRETTGGPAFQSGTYHGFITNGGNDTVIVYESGPSGVAGIGFDNILGAVPESDDVSQVDFVKIEDPRGAAFDPAAPLDLFAHTIGAYVAHRNSDTGEAMVSRVAYSRDSFPGQEVFNASSLNPGFGEKVFEITQQFNSKISGIAYDASVADYNRQLVEESNFETQSALFNAGATIKNVAGSGVDFPRNAKYPLADIIAPFQAEAPRWEPDRLYLGIQGGFIQVFDIQSGVRLKTIMTSGEPTVLASYFEQ